MKERKKYSFLEAKQKIEAWCAYRDRCHSEVLQKLYDFGIDHEDTNALLAHLITTNFLNEQRFANSFVSGKFTIKKWGRNKIISHLKQKRVPDKCISDALLQIDEEIYIQEIKNLAEKKWKEKRGKDFEKKIKVQRFLTQKGYEFELIIEQLKELSTPSPDF